jgi:DNA-binding transcriptional ArsR family regulator
MPPSPPAEPDLRLLAGHLEALASEARLALLHQLRTPKELHAIRLQANRSRAGENAERPLARQTVSHHLEQLEALGLVYRSADAHGVERFALNHQRLFALVDELRGLTRLRPQMVQAVPEGTIPGVPDDGLRLPDGPRLTVAYGWQDGLSFPLQGPAGSRWRIGRAPSCEVALDHDPYVSAENCVVERTASGYVLRDLPGSRNGTQLNWSPLPPGGSAPLASGDVVGAGRTLLVAKL